jgi:thymidylate synthase ThyX
MTHEPLVIIEDSLPPESIAMVAALYSRDPKSVTEHLKKVAEVGADKFMANYYVGYGHASIGDCGSTSIFIEQISMLAAKAIQDWSLYSGQEASTRYIDFSSQPMIDPTDSDAGKAIQEKWRAFYVTYLPRVQEHVAFLYPRREGEDEKVYAKAVKARAFDIMRGFLPAGAATLVAWHTNLRQAADKTQLLRHHPLPEIRAIGENVLTALQTRYPNSFSHQRFENTENYIESYSQSFTYLDPEAHPEKPVLTTTIQNGDLEAYSDLLQNRPMKTGLPTFLNELGQCTFEFLLDFGSFRDLQRHRNGVCRMPLLSTRWGFHPWYLTQLPEDVRTAAEMLLAEQDAAISALNLSPEVQQYFIAMGYRVPCRVTYGLMPTVYTIELRSGKMVHPTLRTLVHDMVREMQTKLPLVKLHVDMDLDDWDVRRGTHDIIKKDA